MLKKLIFSIKVFLLGTIFLGNLFSAADVNQQELEPNSSTIKESIFSQSIEKFKIEALKLGQAACFFSTLGEDPYFKVIDPDADETKIIKCGCYDSQLEKNTYVKNPKDLENIIPLRYFLYGFGGHYKIDKKYMGERKSILGKALETILPNDMYNGTIFIDEYKENIPMFWVLKNAEEFRALSTYILKKFTEQGFVPAKKCLLVLKIKDDPELETIDETDKVFLKTYFELFPLFDKDVKAFFNKLKEAIIDRCFDLDASNPEYVSETILQGAFRQIESHYNKFEFKKIAIIIGAAIATKIIFNFIENEIKDVWGKSIQKITKNNNAKSFSGALFDYFFNAADKAATIAAANKPA